MLLRAFLASFALLTLAAAPVRAEGSGAGCHLPEVGHSAEKVDIITPHITNGDHLEIPYYKFPFFLECTLPTWKPVHLGGLEIDLSPSKHVVFLVLGSAILFLVMVMVARSHRRAMAQGGVPAGGANAIGR